MKKLNLGCGFRYNPDWINLDFKSHGPDVLAWDLRKGIPFPDNNFDVVYHSHLLEHFSKNDAQEFMKDCFRVLRPQGVVRVAVPDLETITRSYLQALELCLQGSRTWSHNYQWLMLEMYDQAVRNHAGGEMVVYLTQGDVPNKRFITSRCGLEAEEIMVSHQAATGNAAANHSKKIGVTTLLRPLNRPLKIVYYFHELLKRLVLGKEYQTLRLGRFKRGGEPHQWMYDRYSLSELLKGVGFENIAQQSATQSYIKNWAQNCLDTSADGSVYKPDSIFMEGIKPSQ